MKYLVDIQGLHCDACKILTEKRINKIPGVTSANTDLSKNNISITSNVPLSIQNIESALESPSYKILNMKKIEE